MHFAHLIGQGDVQYGVLCKRTEKVEDVLNIGDMTWVKVKEIDEKGRVNLSRKDALKEMGNK